VSDWILALSTLAGTALGSAATYLAQLVQYRRSDRDSLIQTRRLIYTNFLGEMHGLFLQVRDVRLQAREDEQLDRLKERLARIQPLGAQEALDQVRLVAAGPTIDTAEQIFQHLRRARGDLQRGTRWSEWHKEYRHLRRVFLDSARFDLGVNGIDDISKPRRSPDG